MAWVFLIIVAVSLISDKNVPACLFSLRCPRARGDWRKVRMRRRRGNVSRLVAPLLLPVPGPWPPIGRGWSRDLNTGLLLASQLPRPGRSQCKLTQVCSAFRQITTGARAGESLDQLRDKTCLVRSNFISIGTWTLNNPTSTDLISRSGKDE